MTHPNVYERYINPSLEEMGSFLDRAQAYERANNLQQALGNYIQALSKLSFAMRLMSQSNLESEIEARRQCPQFLFLLFNILGNIADIYSELSNYALSQPVIYLYQKMRIIYQYLENYEDVFTGEQIEEYQSLSTQKTFAEVIEAAGQESQASLELNNSELINDPLFQEIRKALSHICSGGGSFKDLNLETKSLSYTKSSSSSSSSSSSCFIATAAYQTSIHPDLDTFRNFRDTHLLPHPLGRILVQVYYQIGPKFAQIIRQHPTLQNWVRHQLSHLAIWLRQHQS